MGYEDIPSRRALGLLIEYVSKKTHKNWWFLLVVIAIMILFFVFMAFILSPQGAITI